MRRTTVGIALIAFLTAACATINETYYVAAYDPASSGEPNYYRVQIKGNAGWSKLKYSTGYYDREAVERLFGEFSIQREYEDPDSVGLERFDQLLGDAEFVGLETRVVRLREANAAAGALIAEHRTLLLRRKLAPDLAKAVANEIERLAGLQSKAAMILDEDMVTIGQAGEAMRFIREIEGGIVAIRGVLDDGVIVRFFDGAGNQIDTSNKVQVIFAATDVSQITAAFGKISQAEEEKTQTITLLQADQAAAGNAARRRALESLSRVRDIHAELDGLLAGADPDSPDALLKRALTAAAALADGPNSFNSPEELDAYLEGSTP